MKIANVNNHGMQVMQMRKKEDPFIKNIQKQIMDIQKQLSDLSSNEEISIEDKNDKRKQLMEQISDLTEQLRQHQMEQRQAKQQAKAPYGMGMPSKKSGSSGLMMSTSSMQAIMSADAAASVSRVQGNVATRMQGRANVLKSEIKLDGSGEHVEMKKKELSIVNAKMERAKAAQLNTMEEAKKRIEEIENEEDDIVAIKKAKDKKDKDINDKKDEQKKSIDTSATYLKPENKTGYIDFEL